MRMNKSRFSKLRVLATLLLSILGIICFFSLLVCGFAGDNPPLVCKLSHVFYYIFYPPLLIIASNQPLFETSVGLVISIILIVVWNYLLVNIINFLLTLLRKVRK